MVTEQDPLPSTSAGEITGAVVIAVAVIALVVAAFAYGAGNEASFLVLLAAFAAAVTGLGIRIAGREARYRRDGR